MLLGKEGNVFRDEGVVEEVEVENGGWLWVKRVGGGVSQFVRVLGCSHDHMRHRVLNIAAAPASSSTSTSGVRYNFNNRRLGTP